jgi:hypothetical protein
VSEKRVRVEIIKAEGADWNGADDLTRERVGEGFLRLRSRSAS